MVSVQEDMLNSRVPYSCMEGYTGVHKFFKILRKKTKQNIYTCASLHIYVCVRTHAYIHIYADLT